MYKKTLFFFALLFSCFSYGQTKEQLKHLDNYYQKSMKEWHIPGMAIAIVKNGKIVFSKGYGFANLKKNTKVDGNTLFAIASNTKAFTASAIAQLVDQKKIKWTDKVIDYLPYFKLYDDYTTNHTTIEDLLCHRNGLKTFSGDLLWYGTTLSQEEIITKQQYLKPVYPFRAQYGYSNIAFIAAGKIIEKVTDTTWQNYMNVHFLKPLKMNRTLTSTTQIKNTTNVASPYNYEKETYHKLDWVNWDNVAPAGAFISSVNDYANWLILNANEGVFESKHFLSKESFQNMTTPHINQKVKTNKQKHHFKAYGLGWGLQDYQGHKVIGHGGGYDGMISKSTFVPEKKLGIIVLTNSLNWLPTALVNKTLDVILANEFNGKDWSGDWLKYKINLDKEKAKKTSKNELLRGKINKHHLNFKEYIGIYKDKMYGTVTVSIKNNQLHFTMDNTPLYYADLHHWNDHIFTFNFSKKCSLPEGKLWFNIGKNGKVIQLHIDVRNPDFFFDEFVFEKIN